MKLWTVTSDYFATGEGRTMQALITYAEDEKEAIENFGKVFNPYFASGAQAQEGVIKNEITKYLFAPKIFESVKQMEGKANVRLSAEMHFNFS